MLYNTIIKCNNPEDQYFLSNSLDNSYLSSEIDNGYDE